MIGILEGKKGLGKTILLRSEHRRLPIEGEKQVSRFLQKKQELEMHACGHDGHTAWLLGSAMILSQLREHFYRRH